ncbi:MAG: hypothetical protein Ct9H300mP14_07540 [Gammaproteobacteria bacterium]|nr:MAG: hypothetical protein Ct9H300mP14_07540 [Gammaproteobacteria bacterium]
MPDRFDFYWLNVAEKRGGWIFCMAETPLWPLLGLGEQIPGLHFEVCYYTQLSTVLTGVFDI